MRLDKSMLAEIKKAVRALAPAIKKGKRQTECVRIGGSLIIAKNEHYSLAYTLTFSLPEAVIEYASLKALTDTKFPELELTVNDELEVLEFAHAGFAYKIAMQFAEQFDFTLNPEPVKAMPTMKGDAKRLLGLALKCHAKKAYKIYEGDVHFCRNYVFVIAPYQAFVGDLDIDGDEGSINASAATVLAKQRSINCPQKIDCTWRFSCGQNLFMETEIIRYPDLELTELLKKFKELMPTKKPVDAGAFAEMLPVLKSEHARGQYIVITKGVVSATLHGNVSYEESLPGFEEVGEGSPYGINPADLIKYKDLQRLAFGQRCVCIVGADYIGLSSKVEGDF